MSHDIFISYSHKDKPIADAICANLESAGFRCWIAPRDIAPGLDWPTAISNAISASRMMVLVFSANSNSSNDVSRELILAANNDLIIIPFKLDNISPEPGKQYYLARTHWLDAMNPPTQEQINTLVGHVRSFLSEKGVSTMVQPASEVKPPSDEVVSPSPVVVSPPAEMTTPAPEVKSSPSEATSPAPPFMPPPSKPVKGRIVGYQKSTRRKNAWIWGVLLGIAVIAGGTFAIRSFVQAPASPDVTPSFTPTFTSSPTSTPNPTATLTPLPGWVTTFARPILDAIVGRTPNFQDDFRDSSGGWQLGSYFADWRLEYLDGEVILNRSYIYRNNIDYRTYVVEVDARFLSGSDPTFSWLVLNSPIHAFEIYYDGSVVIDNNNISFPPNTAKPGTQSNHLMIIVKIPGIAFYLNGQPLGYLENNDIEYGEFRLRARNPDDGPGGPMVTIAAFDNFKIWDITDLP